MYVDALVDVASRLAPLAVPVLMPSQVGLPDEGGLPDQPSGLEAFLQAQAPDGYVQLYELTPSYTASGVYDTSVLTVDTVGLTRELALSLAGLVRRTLSRTPRRGGRITTFLPERTEQLDGALHRVTLQFEVRGVRTGE